MGASAQVAGKAGEETLATVGILVRLLPVILSPAN